MYEAWTASVDTSRLLCPRIIGSSLATRRQNRQHSRTEAAMRRLLTSLALPCLLLPPSADAHTMKVGLEAGLGYTSFAYASGASLYSTDRRWHPAGGVVVDLPVRGRLHFTPALRYEEQGEKVETADMYFTERQVIRERLLSTSLLLRYQTFYRLFALLGWQADYFLSRRLSGTYSSALYPRINYETDYTDRSRRLDLLINVGIAIEVPAGRHMFGIETRYAHGLMEESRPLGYYPPNARPIAWSASNFYPYPMISSRTRRVEASIRILW